MFHQPNPPVKVGEWGINISTKGLHRGTQIGNWNEREMGADQ